MNNEQRSGLITAIIIAAVGIITVNVWLYFPVEKPIESTRNDDCKITVIGE